MSAVAISAPRPDWRALRAGLLAAVSLAGGYGLIVWLASQSWSHVLVQWRTDALFIVLVALGFGTQMGLYSYTRRIIRDDGKTTAVAAGSAATSTTAMVACCLHHLSDVVPFLGLSGAATFLIAYKVPVVLLSLAANGIGIALQLRTLSHAGAMKASPPAECH